MNFTTFDQSKHFAKLSLPVSDSIVYSVILPEQPEGWLHYRKTFVGVYFEGTEFYPAYSLAEMLSILTHHYRIKITSFMGERYQVEAEFIRGYGQSAGQGKTVAEACGWLLLELLKNDKFFTEQVCKDTIKRYISTHEQNITFTSHP